MPKYKIYLNDSLNWTGNAANVEAAIHAAAKKRGQVWNIRLDTPLDDSRPGGKVFLHTDKEIPDRIIDTKPLDVVPLVHDMPPHLKPGERLRIWTLAEFAERNTPPGPIKAYGAND